MSPHRLVIGFIAGTILLGAGLELIPPLVMKQVVDGHLATGISAGLWPLAFLYLASVAGVQGLGFLSSYLTALAAQGALRDLRVRLYRHLQRLPLSYHDQTPLGDTISRCTADVDTLDTLFSSGVAGLITDLVRLVTVSIAMIALSPLLSLVSALIVPPLLWVTNAFRKRIRAAERRNRQAVGLMNTHLQETLGGVEVIRAFGREAAFAARFRRVLKQTLDAYNQAAKYSALYQPIMQILMACGDCFAVVERSAGHLRQLADQPGHVDRLRVVVQTFLRPDHGFGRGVADGAERPFGGGAHLPGARHASRRDRWRSRSGSGQF